MAKSLWHIVRVAFFMLRKNITKRKLLLDLKYLTLKRSKLTGKTPTGKLRHHQSGGAYELSCTNTPNHHFPFHLPLTNKNKAHHNHVEFDPHAQTNYDYEAAESEADAVNRVLEIMVVGGNGRDDDVEAWASPYPHLNSPVLPGLGFGRSPAVRQLRVTDSPYPLQEEEVGNYRVDEAAEEFIQRFYAQLNQQMITCA